MAVFDLKSGNPVDLPEEDVSRPESAGPSEFHGNLDRLISDAPGKVWVNSGYRSNERQAQLYDAAIKKYGSETAARHNVAPPGRSMHNHDLASDLGYESDDVKKWVHENAANYGLHFPMGHEPWHVEPIGARRRRGEYQPTPASEPPLAAGIKLTDDMEFEPLERPKAPEPIKAEEPGLLKRGLSAVKSAVEHIEPAEQFKLPVSKEQRREYLAAQDPNSPEYAAYGQPKMVGLDRASYSGSIPEKDRIKADPDLIQLHRELGVPVKPEYMDRVRDLYESATPDQRKRFMGEPGPLGAVSRYFNKKYQGGSIANEDFGGRVEDIASRNRSNGMDPKSAQAMAEREADFNAAPIKGQAQSTDFNFERSKELRNASPITRGVIQGGDILKQQAAGLNKMVADVGESLGVPGAAGYGRAQLEARKRLGMRQTEMGEAPNDFNRNLEGAIASTISNAPGYAVGLFTGGQTIPLLMMSSQVAGDEYANGIEHGLSKPQALTRSVGMGAAEYLGEKLGFKDQVNMLKRAAGGNWRDFEKQFVKTMAEQIAGEEGTTLAQFGIDKSRVGLNPEATAQDLFKQVKDTLHQTVIQTALMGAPGSAAAVHRRLQESDARHDQPFADAFAPVRETHESRAIYDDTIKTPLSVLRTDPGFRQIVQNDTNEYSSGLERGRAARQELAKRRALDALSPAPNSISGQIESPGIQESTKTQGVSNAENPIVQSSGSAESRQAGDQTNQSQQDHAGSTGSESSQGGQEQEGLLLTPYSVQKTPDGKFAVVSGNGNVESIHDHPGDAFDATLAANQRLHQEQESQDGNRTERMEQRREGDSSAPGKQNAGMDGRESASDAEAGTDRQSSEPGRHRGLSEETQAGIERLKQKALAARDNGETALADSLESLVRRAEMGNFVPEVYQDADHPEGNTGSGIEKTSGGRRATERSSVGTGAAAVGSTGGSAGGGTGGVSESVSTGAGDAGDRGDSGHSLGKRKESEAPVIQNRDRSNPASIQQMQSIAARPHYLRLGPGNDFANGAPVVVGGNIPAIQLGNKDIAVTAKNREIPFQYAAIEAWNLVPSHKADGSPNPEYDDIPKGKFKVIAGNGRVAGLQKAHQQGSAFDYVHGMYSDQHRHGIEPTVVGGVMSRPILVRVMSESDLTKDIGDESNIGNGLELSPLEKAKNDSQRIDLGGLDFNDDGEINERTVKQFVRTMPENEQGALLDTDGTPNRDAYDRLKASIFFKAYRNDELVRLFSQAADPEARLVMSALARVAPKMARLEGTGYEDISDLVAEAAISIVNGKRSGLTMQQIAKQIDITHQPGTADILALFADNPRSNKMAIEALTDAADFAFEESNNPGEDLFGERQKATRQDVLDRLRKYRGQQEESLEHAGGSESPEGNDGTKETGRERQGDAEAIQRGEQEGQGGEEALAPIKERRAARKARKESFASPEQEQQRADLIWGIESLERRLTKTKGAYDRKRIEKEIAQAEKELKKLPEGMLTREGVSAIPLGSRGNIAESRLVQIDVDGAHDLIDETRAPWVNMSPEELYAYYESHYETVNAPPPITLAYFKKAIADRRGTGSAKQDVGTNKAEIRQGQVGMMLSPGEVVRTSSGRETSPFPNFNGKDGAIGRQGEAKVTQWLIKNAYNEALHRLDEFNSGQFLNDIGRNDVPQASKDAAEEYLFGKQPAVVPSILKPLNQGSKAESLSPEETSDDQNIKETEALIEQAISKFGSAKVQSIFEQAAKDMTAGKGQYFPLVRKSLEQALSGQTSAPIQNINYAAYQITGQPAYETFGPLSHDDALFELDVLRDEAKKGKLTPQRFANSEIGQRLDTGLIGEINNQIKANEFGWIDRLADRIRETSKQKGGSANLVDDLFGAPTKEDQQRSDKEAVEAYAKEKARQRNATGQEISGGLFDQDNRQADVFSEPSNRIDRLKAAEKPATPTSEGAQKAQADLDDALKDLGQVFLDANLFVQKAVPTNELDEAKLIPVLARLLDAAFRLGYHKFKDASKFALDTIRAKFGDAAADSITLDHLQGSYIAMSGKYRDQGADTKKDVVSVESLAEIHQGETNVTDRNSDSNLERDRENADTQNGLGQEGVRSGSARNGGVRGAGIQQGEGEARTLGSSELHGRETVSPREPSDLTIYRGSTESADSDAGDRLGSGGDLVGVSGSPVEPNAAGPIKAAARSRSEVKADQAEQTTADAQKHNGEGLDEIKAALPALLPGQQEDVLKAEKRFSAPDGYGMLFTNGTGTGKTFTGLGVIKRFANLGKTNIIILAPNDKIIEDWIKSGKILNLPINRLDDTKDAGKGITITTYANFGSNNALADRNWDLTVTDEAHYLMQDGSGKPTQVIQNLRAITKHPDGAYRRAEMLHRDLRDEIEDLSKQVENANKTISNSDTMDSTVADLQKLLAVIEPKLAAAGAKWSAALEKVKADVAASQNASRPRSLFLSATPFAYEPTVDWANGYLFDYSEGQSDESKEFRGYNQGSNKDRFFMTHFGYRMRYNKLTKPDAKVDSGLMQRQFNTWLKKRGSLSGRMLDVAADYDRRFILVESAIGTRIDQALEWFHDEADRIKDEGGDPNGVGELEDAVGDKFDYLSRRYLLEAIKASEVIKHVKEHMAIGRKVVVFHDYKKGGGFHPFRINRTSNPLFNEALDKFNTEFKDLIGIDFASMPNPIEVFRREFPDVLLFNGDVPAKVRRANVEKFQDDASGPQVILVQSAAGKEGISLHDTTGKHQRVLLNLGQPTQPTTAIQQEGRIYRTGQVTDAIFRYLNTGTNWERWAFATTIAQRASAAENLGMGEQARALKDAFIAGFEESGDYPAGMEDEGKGGKERDRLANEALTEWDRAKAFYYGTQKKTSKTKAQEGADYFATPEPLGLKMVEWLQLLPGEKALEPSAGHGAIARWLPENTERTAVEPSRQLLPKLAMVFDGKIVDTNFEQLNIVNKFDGIVMNPPFGSGGKTAVDHLAKAAQHLRDGGRIVALIPAGPAADKQLDKFLHDETRTPIEPTARTKELGPVYVGDTIKTSYAWMPEGKVIGTQGDQLLVRRTGANHATAVNPEWVTELNATGRREKVARRSENLYTVADIYLPSSVFERAGTSVNTHIVVLEKQEDPEKAKRIQQSSRDYSGAKDINEFFDRIEESSLPARIGKEATSLADQVDSETKPTPKGQVEGNRYVTDAPAITHTTMKGKTIEGVIARDLTAEEAQAIDPYTWKKDGGFFIRMKHVDRPGSEEKVFKNDILEPLPEDQWMSSEDIREITSHLLKPFATAIPLRIEDSVIDVAGVNEESNGASGLLFNGSLYLFRNGLANRSDVVKTLWHELLHFGLRRFMTKSQYIEAMNDLYNKDPWIRERADLWIQSDDAAEIVKSSESRSYLRARGVDEALAYLAELIGSQREAQKKVGRIRRAIRAISNWISRLAEKYGYKEASEEWKTTRPTQEAADLIAGIFTKLRDGNAPINGDNSWSSHDPAFSKKNVLGEEPLATWTSPGATSLDDFIYRMQDKLIDTKRVQEAIKGIEDEWNPYQKEMLYHGRAAKQTEDFLTNEVKPLVKAMQDKGVSMDELETYLWNRHAQERNEQIAKINPKMLDGGSGILTQDAQDYLKGLSPEKQKDLEALAGLVDKINSNTKKILIDSGLEVPETIAAWDEAYKFYVPLMRGESDISNRGNGTGQGFSVRGPASKRAMGSDKPVVDIIANILMQRERTIVRAEKNRVGVALYGLAIQNENPNFWLPVNPEAIRAPRRTRNELQMMGLQPDEIDGLMREPATRYIDQQTGLVAARINPALRNRDNVLAVRVNGKDRFIFFNTGDPRAARMVESLKNLDSDQLGSFLSGVRMFTHAFASMNTQYNPIFGVVNLLRDLGAGALNLTSTEIAGKEKDVLAHVGPAIVGIYADLRADRAGRPRSAGQWAKLWEDFQEHGGKTGYRDNYRTSEDRAIAIQRMLDPSSWADHGLGRFFTADGRLKVPMEMVRKAASPLVTPLSGWLSDFNETTENAIRLSAYKVAIDAGISTDKAAAIAKNLTVNFNKKGQLASQLGALYAFFNANAQGTARILETLNGPAGKKIIAGGLLVGVLQAVMMAAAGYDDDEPPQFTRERNFVIPVGDKYFSVPYALGYHVLPNTGRILMELVLSGGKHAGDKVFDLMAAYIESFNPMGSGKSISEVLSPTITDPIVALERNTDAFGRPIAKQDRSGLDPTPGFTRSKDTASLFGKWFAKVINTLTGGDDYKPGRVSPTPDQIDYLIGQATGGVGREAIKAEQAVGSLFTGEQLPPYKIPLAGRFYGNAHSASAERDRFYRNVTELNVTQNEIEGLKKAHKQDELKAFKESHPESKLIRKADDVERRLSLLNARKRFLQRKGDSKDEIKKVESRISDLMKDFNDQVKQVAK